MNTKDAARLTQYHYLVDKYEPDKAVKKINKRLKKNNLDHYQIKDLTRGVLHYKNSKDNSNIISIKGTNKYDYRDLVSDVKLGLGFSKYDKQMKERKKQIKNIYKENEGQNFLIGHSLGSSIMTNALIKSKSIRDNTKKAIGFNTGYTKLFHKEIKPDKEVKKELKQKLTHYHAEGDIISSSLKDKRHGDLETVKTETSNPLQNHSLDNFTE